MYMTLMVGREKPVIGFDCRSNVRDEIVKMHAYKDLQLEIAQHLTPEHNSSFLNVVPLLW